MTEKDDKLALKLRTDGNMLFVQSKFYDALVAYNKSLCFADPSSENIALAYANRSAVYLEVNQHQKCLENIKLAQEREYKNVKKLKEREDRCQKLMMEYNSDPNDDPWTFFKLSYPAHEKIPFMANCLELRENEEYGRHIITNRQLNPGDIVLIEEPFMKSIEPSVRYVRCSHCLKSNLLSLFPCSRCTKTMFCSVFCRYEANKRYHELECIIFNRLSFSQLEHHKVLLNIFRGVQEALMICDGNLNKLDALFDDFHQKVTAFDLDHTYATDFELLNVISSLNPNPSNGGNNWLKALNKLLLIKEFVKTDREIAIFKKVAHKFLAISNCNSFNQNYWTFDQSAESITNKIGNGIPSVASLLNHSCAPNISRVCVDNKLAFVVKRTIPKNGQLFIIYRNEFENTPKEERQQYLMKTYNFLCGCEACIGNFPTIPALKKFDDNFIDPGAMVVFGKAAKDILTEGNNYIKQNDQKHYPCCEISCLMNNNLYMLHMIARMAPFFPTIV